MRTRNLITMSLILISLLIISGCGGKKYDDVKNAIQKQTKLMEGLAVELDKATDATGVAKAINNFADGMEKLLPEMKKLRKKYPELEDEDNLPEELKEAQDNAEEMAKKYGGSMMKIMPYMNDPEDQKAQQRMNEVIKNNQE